MYAQEVSQIVTATLLFYEHLITLKDEIRYIWLRGISGFTVIFVMLRYGNLLFFLFAAAQTHLSGSQDDYKCQVFVTLENVMQVVIFAVLGLFCSLRMYAVTSKSRPMSALVAIIMTVFVVLQLFTIFWGVHIFAETLPVHGCYTLTDLSVVATSQTLANIGMGFGLLGELAVQLATWRSTFGIYRSLKRLNMPQELTTLLLYDGTLLYCFLLIWLLLSELAFAQILTSSNTTVISIAICRFILRLCHLYGSAETALSSVGPSLVIGNMGASFQFSPEENNEGPDFYEGATVSSRALETSLPAP